ncbi:hypothetical protein MNBD_GAMMA14-1820 [hydrothermal vent metagenome]|uniref:MSHA biogenesis protein MshI n=1 Tax=hydrothermal vent metagenome TaxID=652676 RepID=A0A3B0Z698_9ZZZZ
MHQQINLFQPLFRKQQKVFSATTLVQIVGAVTVLLLIFLGHARWTLANMEATANNMQKQYIQLQRQVSTLQAVLNTPDTEALDNEIEQLRIRIDTHKALLAHFEPPVTENQRGFYSRFRLLAEQNISDLWLEGITMEGNGHIEIRGSTSAARQVPAYIQHLSKQPELSSARFETVQLIRPDIKQSRFRFSLRNFHEGSAWD